VAWQILVRNYTRCGLSKENDKLVAMNGIRQLLTNMTGHMFICGLWRSRLIQELGWMRSHLRRDPSEVSRAFYPQKWRAPTWSWANTNVEMHPGHLRHHLDCPKLQHRVIVEGIDSDEFNSGQLKHAQLTLRGRLVRATLAIRGPPFVIGSGVEFICDSASITAELRSEVSFEFFLDDIAAEPHYREEMVCLAMWACDCKEMSGDDETIRILQALVLRPHRSEEGHYERVGIVYMRNSSYDFYLENESKDEHSLVLV
jgi:hypothetical protein